MGKGSEEADEKITEGPGALRLGDERVLCRLLLLSVSPAPHVESVSTHLLVDILKVLKPVGNILFIANVVLGDLLLASYALKDAVDEVGQSLSVVCSVLFEPIFCDRVGGLSGSEDLS